MKMVDNFINQYFSINIFCLFLVNRTRIYLRGNKISTAYILNYIYFLIKLVIRNRISALLSFLTLLNFGVPKTYIHTYICIYLFIILYIIFIYQRSSKSNSLQYAGNQFVSCLYFKVPEDEIRAVMVNRAPFVFFCRDTTGRASWQIAVTCFERKIDPPLEGWVMTDWIELVMSCCRTNDLQSDLLWCLQGKIHARAKIHSHASTPTTKKDSLCLKRILKESVFQQLLFWENICGVFEGFANAYGIPGYRREL